MQNSSSSYTSMYLFKMLDSWRDEFLLRGYPEYSENFFLATKLIQSAEVKRFWS